MKRIGLIGAGWVTEHHLDAYQALHKRAAVVALADPSTEARTKRSKRYAVPRTYESAEQMLDTEQLDAVDIAAPREHHASLIRLAAAHGLPILCQKPLVPTLTEAEQLVRELGDSTRLMVHENWRFRPHYRQIHSWLRAGRIGKLTQAHMNLFTSGLVADANGQYPAVERQPFMADLDRMLLMEVMIHHTDTLRFLLRELTVEAAHLAYECPAIRGESAAMLMFKSADGIGVSLIGNFISYGAPAQQLDNFRILGTAGSITLEGSSLTLHGSTPERIALDLPANYKASYEAAIEHFLDCLDTGDNFETSASDNIETLRLIETGYQVEGSRRC